jgi:hypothetical protein
VDSSDSTLDNNSQQGGYDGLEILKDDPWTEPEKKKETNQYIRRSILRPLVRLLPSEVLNFLEVAWASVYNNDIPARSYVSSPASEKKELGRCNQS